MLSHHTWSPSAPLIKVVAQGMPASEPKWLFFWRPFQAKRCNNIELGERGHASFFAISLTGLLLDVQTQAWINSLVHLPQPQSKHTLIFKAATQQAKKHKTYFFWFMAVQTQAWTNSLLHMPKPQPKRTFIFTAATHKQRMCPHASRSRTAQTACFAQCTYSASQCTLQCTPQCTATKRSKYHGISVFWPFTKTRRRMARERRGANSSLVSMEAPYYKTIY